MKGFTAHSELRMEIRCNLKEESEGASCQVVIPTLINGTAGGLAHMVLSSNAGPALPEADWQ